MSESRKERKRRETAEEWDKILGGGTQWLKDVTKQQRHSEKKKRLQYSHARQVSKS